MNMHWKVRIAFFLAALFTFATIASASTVVQSNVWTKVDSAELRSNGIDRGVMPTAYETFRLDRAALEAILDRAPEEFTGASEVILSLPMPDGTFQRFSIFHSMVVEQGLADRFPELGQTYSGQGIDDPMATVRFDLMSSGFHSMILSPNGTVMVDPAVGDANNYISYFKRDRPRVGSWECLFDQQSNFDSILHPMDPENIEFLRNVP